MKRFQLSKLNNALSHRNISVSESELQLMDDYLFDGTKIVKYAGYQKKGVVANKLIGSIVGAVIGLALYPVLGPLGFQLGIVIGGLIGSLFERKKTKEEQKFKPEAQFNTELVVAKYGDPIAMIFCNKDENHYGGVRVSGNLINARVTNVKGEEYVKMLFVIGLGELGSATQDPYDLSGFQFGEEKIDLDTNTDVVVKTTRGTATQPSFNNEFPYASQVKTPQQNKSCSSKFILRILHATTGGSSPASDYDLTWSNVPFSAITPVDGLFYPTADSQLADTEYYSLQNTSDGGLIEASFDLGNSLTGYGEIVAVYKQDCTIRINSFNGIDYIIDFYLEAGVPKAEYRIVGALINQTYSISDATNKEYFIRFRSNGSFTTPLTIEMGAREYIAPLSGGQSREVVYVTNSVANDGIGDFTCVFDYSQNPLILTLGNITPIDWVIGATGGNAVSPGTFVKIQLDKDLISAISYGVDYALFGNYLESDWFRFTYIDTENFYGITDCTTNFPIKSNLFQMSEFIYETSKPCDIVEINLFGIIWSRDKKTGDLVTGTQMFDVYATISPGGNYVKLQRFLVQSNNTSGIKRQLRLEFNTKNYRSIKIRPVVAVRGDTDVRKIAVANTESSIGVAQGAYSVNILFQEDAQSLNGSVPDDPFNPRPPFTPAPTWLDASLGIFFQASNYSHSSQNADPLVVNSINEVAYYPQNFDGTYPNYAMYSVITISSVRTNPINPSIVVTRGVRGKTITGVATVVTKNSPIVALTKSEDFLLTDIVYCPRLDLIIVPDAITVNTITLPSAVLVGNLSVGDVLITYRLGNISRWPDVFNHILTDPAYLGDIVKQTLVDAYSLIESKQFVISRDYFYDFAQIQTVSFQQWALANSAFSLLLPKKSGGKYGLMPIVRTDIKEMYSNYNIIIDTYSESSVPYKDTDIDNLGVKTVDGRENRYRERQVGVVRQTNFNYSFVIEAQSITREQQGKDFAVYSMNSRVYQDTIVEFSTDWEGANVGVGELVYVLREENLYAKESSGIIVAINTLLHTITLSNFEEGATKLLVFTQNTKEFLEFDIIAVSSDTIGLTSVALLSVGDTFILGDLRLIKHRYITQNKSLDIEQNLCKLSAVNYPDNLESIVGLTIYSDYFNSTPIISLPGN